MGEDASVLTAINVDGELGTFSSVSIIVTADIH
jgi:hypothetical protein